MDQDVATPGLQKTVEGTGVGYRLCPMDRAQRGAGFRVQGQRCDQFTGPSAKNGNPVIKGAAFGGPMAICLKAAPLITGFPFFALEPVN